MDEFDFIYNGLRKKLNLEDDTLTLNVTKKTYRLIKTTKLLIQKEKNFESIKRLSVLVIKLIDKFFWDKDGSSIKNPYFRNGFNDWLKAYHREDHGSRKRTNEGNRWEPKLILNNGIVELIPPIHKIKDTVCYSDIRVVVKNDEEVLNLCNEYKEKLNKEGIEAYVDLTDKSPGFKFAEAEVNGIPVRIELGKRDLENNKITFARRDTREKIEENINIDIVSYTKKLLETIQKGMYERAKKRRDELTFEAHNKEEIEKILNTQPGFIHAMWCGDIKCEEEIKQIKGCKSRCIVNEKAIDEKCVCCGKDAKYHVIWGIQY